MPLIPNFFLKKNLTLLIALLSLSPLAQETTYFLMLGRSDFVSGKFSVTSESTLLLNNFKKNEPLLIPSKSANFSRNKIMVVSPHPKVPAPSQNPNYSTISSFWISY